MAVISNASLCQCAPAVPVASFKKKSARCAPAVVGLAKHSTVLSSSKVPTFAQKVKQWTGASRSVTVCAAGDVSAEGTTYLIAGAIAIALVGSALPILFSRKDLCPVCDGAGFVRAGDGATALNANAARKDQAQIVCKNCSGLGKIGQTDKK